MKRPLIAIISICGVFAIGYFAGRYATQRETADAATVQRDANREKFAKDLIQLNAQVESNDLTLDRLHETAKRYRVAWNTYVFNARHLKVAASTLEIENNCLSEGADMMDDLSFRWEFCDQSPSNCKGAVSEAYLKSLGAARGKLEECLQMFMR
jgi:hypothetical protein